MILVTVGASPFPFDRLLVAVDDLSPGEPVVVQHGPSTIRPTGAECVEYLPMPELAELVRDARAVVTHAGVGSILLTLANGRRPHVVPRRRDLAEAVDDHQLESARSFSRSGFVTLVEDAADLGRAVRDARDVTIAPPAGGGQLGLELRAYLDGVVTRAGVPVPA